MSFECDSPAGYPEYVYLSDGTRNDVYFDGFERFNITGTQGDDLIYARAATQGVVFYGLASNDTLTGGAGADYLDGGAGDDTFNSVGVGDIVVGGTGTDRVNFDLSAATQNITIDLSTGEGAGASWTAIEQVSGSLGSGDDIVNASFQLGSIYGNGGLDSITLDYSGTLADGRSATQIVFNYLARSGYPDYVYLSDGTRNDVYFDGFERFNITGTSGNDQINGSAALSNTFYGREGDDTLTGGAGDDSLIGEAGNDYLNGGNGYDKAFFRGNQANYTIVQTSNGYTVTDNVGDEGTDTLVNIEELFFQDLPVGSNHSPVAEDDEVTSDKDSGVYTINELTLLGNDSDPDAGDTLTLVSVSSDSEAGASVTLVDGEVFYDPGSLFQGLRAGETSTDRFTYTISDNQGAQSTATVTVTIKGVSDPTTFGGETSGTVSDDVVLSASGTLAASDPESGDAAIIALTDITGTYGSFRIGTNGAWLYSLNNGATNVQALNGGQTVTDTFTVTTAGGATQDITIPVNGANDPTAFTGDLSGTVTEDGTLEASGTLAVSDADEGEAAIVAQQDSVGAYGLFSIGANGGWTYSLNNGAPNVQALRVGETVLDVFTVYTAGGSSHEISITVNGAYDMNVITGTERDDTLTGTVDNEVIFGLGGNDYLDGRQGADTLIGGLGDDSYVVDNASDVVTEAPSEGIDTVISTVTRTLGSYQENLTLAGTAAINATGNTLANKLIGNSAANVLNGSTGADSMYGGLGNDTYYVDNAGDVVSESSSTGGIDTVIATVTRTLGNYQEHVTLAGTAAINGTGNTLANKLIGNSAANVLNGSTGADSMYGGLGNDTYYVDNVGDVVSESSSTGGIDTVISTVTRTLGSYQENLTLAGTAAINATGNTLANKLTGNSANNVLSGEAGHDTLIAGSGNDLLRGGTGNDILYGGVGKDLFRFDTALGTSTTPNIDQIKDFSVLDDTIQLENAIFTRFGTSTTGTINAAYFKANTTGLAADSNDYIIYETDTGELFYDSNGSAAGGSVQIALLGINLALTSADFVLI